MPKAALRLAVAGLIAAVATAGTASATERLLLAPQQPANAPAGSARSVASAPSKETTPGTIAQLRTATDKSGRVRVIVGYRVPFAAEALLSAKERSQQQQEIAAAGADLRKKFPSAGKRNDGIRTFSSVPFAAMEVTRAELDRLAADPSVLTIVEDQKVQPQLTYSVPLIGAPQAWKLGATGAGQSVAVIDVGFDTSHPFLRGKVVYEAGCTSGICTPGKGRARVGSDGFAAHGTAVAGIIAGERPQSASSKPDALTGVAPGARLMVFGTTSTSDIIAALENVNKLRDQGANIAAVNISLAFPTRKGDASVPLILDQKACDTYNFAMNAAVANLRSKGTATVVAAGNNGDTKWGPGSTEKLSYPACLSSVVSVGATFADRRTAGYMLSGIAMCGTSQSITKDGVICYSNTSPELTILAPGYPIETATMNGGYDPRFGGTSAAAPHVAGAFAVLKSAVPAATVTQIIEAIRLTGKPVKDYRNNRVVKRIDIAQALAYLQGGKKAVVAYSASGNGLGTVSFSPAGNRGSCADDCSVTFDSNTTVTIKATPEPGSRFLGWDVASGECRSADLTCTLTVNRQETQVGAKFGRIPGFTSYMVNYYRSGMGFGTITAFANGREIDCRDMICNRTLPAGTIMTLSASPGDGVAFTGWTGACSKAGTELTCSFPLTSMSTATAVFNTITIKTVSLTVMKMGSGAITAKVDGRPVDCSGQFCTLTGPAGAKVELSAAPAQGNTFGGWTGLCTATAADCAITLKDNGITTASFKAVPGKLAANP